MPYTSPHISIVDVPGKNKGIIATQAIPRGTLVLSEPPLFVVSVACSNTAVVSALRSLSRQSLQDFFSLCNAHPGQQIPFSIWKTNAFPLGSTDSLTGASATGTGIFLQASRINSACTPNVNNFWQASKKELEIYAMEDIAAGEELCICYSGLLEPRDVRRQVLQKKFRFDCMCKTCLLTGTDLTTSDERRTSIKKLHVEIGTCGRNPKEGMRKVREALSLASEEKLYPYIDGFCYDAFQFCVSVPDTVRARSWIQQAIKWKTAVNGTTSIGPDWKRYVQDPSAHSASGILPRHRLPGPDFALMQNESAERASC